MKATILFLAFCIALCMQTTEAKPQGGGCIHWCKNLDKTGFYCCKKGTTTTTTTTPKPGNRPGSCPKVRPHCPEHQKTLGAPQYCSYDGACPGTQKCCMDVCIKRHICKPAQF